MSSVMNNYLDTEPTSVPSSPGSDSQSLTRSGRKRKVRSAWSDAALDELLSENLDEVSADLLEYAPSKRARVSNSVADSGSSTLPSIQVLLQTLQQTANAQACAAPGVTVLPPVIIRKEVQVAVEPVVSASSSTHANYLSTMPTSNLTHNRDKGRICANRECENPAGQPDKPKSLYCSKRCQSREQNLRQGRIKTQGRTRGRKRKSVRSSDSQGSGESTWSPDTSIVAVSGGFPGLASNSSACDTMGMSNLMHTMPSSLQALASLSNHADIVRQVTASIAAARNSDGHH